MFFSRNKKLAVSNFVVKLVNNNCPDLIELARRPARRYARQSDGRRAGHSAGKEKIAGCPRRFTPSTKDFSSTSVSVMVDSPRDVDDAILAFRWEGEMYFVRANAKHLTPLGGGFHQLGFQMEEMVSPKDYPELANLSF